MYRPLPDCAGAVANQAVKSLTAEFTVPQRVVPKRTATRHHRGDREQISPVHQTHLGWLRQGA